MLTFLAGESVGALRTLALARSAGSFVGRFHDALSAFPHTFAFTRAGVHDTAAHRAKLSEVRSREVPERGPIDALADLILAYPLPTIPALPTRIVHGDLKATNLLFEGDTAVGIVDLDTLSHGTIALEMGDALRSWCNPKDESDTTARFDASTFEAALEGYAESTHDFLTAPEARSIVGGAETIALELACRFCVDVYEDRYFGFDPSRYPSRRAHNIARTRAQLSLARSIRDLREALDAIVERLFFS
jgi:Ser/Thr protein kinase RdoA (MazF antagonist)